MTAAQEGDRGRVEVLLRDEGGATTAQQREWLDRLWNGGTGDGPDAARAQAREILGREEFLEPERGLLDRFFDWLFENDDEDDETATSEIEPPPAGDSGSGIDTQAIVLGLLIAVGIALLVVLASRYAANRRRDEAAVPETAALVASRVRELRAMAREAEAEGDWIRALRLHFFALVVGLGERGDLEYRDAWTNRELLERGRPAREVERALRPFVRLLDAHSFGNVPSGPEEVREFRALCDRMLEAGA